MKTGGSFQKHRFFAMKITPLVSPPLVSWLWKVSGELALLSSLCHNNGQLAMAISEKIFAKKKCAPLQRNAKQTRKLILDGSDSGELALAR